MNKEKQNDETTTNSIDEKTKNTDKSSDDENNLKTRESKIDSSLLLCLRKTIKKILKKINCFELTILTQYLFILIPFSIILFLVLLCINYHAFERVIKFDIYFAIRDEYLKHIISDLDDIHIDIGSSETINRYEDLENLAFYKIYFRELISMGLLNESSNNKIFSDISGKSDTLYKPINTYKKSSHFTIPQNESFQYIDNRTDSFSELAKLYYYMLPTTIVEYYSRDIYINQSFLIAYEYDSNNNIINNDPLFFAFPLSDNEVTTQNFKVDDGYIWPKISEEEVFHGEKYNNSFYKENWFTKQDYDFRLKANEKNNAEISLNHLNYDFYGKLNKSYIMSMQNFVTYDNHKYIINIIFFINQRDLKDQSFDYSTFLIFNDTDSINVKEKERYSDNKTYLIYKSNIMELSLSDILYNYFHFGIYDNNYNFYLDGKSFDAFDIEKLGEPLQNYNTVKNFNIDLRLFSSLYLYTLLFIKSKYDILTKEKNEIKQFNFEENQALVTDICHIYNFTSYKEYLKHENIDCWNIQNMLYYSQKEISGDKSLQNYINIPYCICLPLYCLKDNTKDFVPNATEYANKIILPDRCQNYIRYYQNDNKDKKNISTTILEIAEKINIFSNKLAEKIEDEFYIFKYMELSNFPDTNLFLIYFVNNTILKTLLINFLNNMSEYQFYFHILITIFFLVLIIIATNILIRNIMRISEVIFSFQKKYEYYLYQSSLDNDNNADINNDNRHEKNNIINKEDNIFNSSENKPLLEKKQSTDNFDNFVNLNESPLLDDLLKIFYKCYNITADNLLKQIHKSEKFKSLEIKMSLLKEKNELFQLLFTLSLYAPLFKLNASMDYNFYSKTKLNQNFVKSIKKNGFTSNPEKATQTQGVLFELLSTENIDDYGILANVYFKYVTNINIESKNNNSIKKSIFTYKKNYNIEIEDEPSKKKEEEDSNVITKVMSKEKNPLLDELERGFEIDDYLKKDKLDSAFKLFLVNVYYKYNSKIFEDLEGNREQDNVE